MENRKPLPLISIVIPVYNEANNIEVLVKEIDTEIEKLKEKYEFEVIFINDGSTDKTYEIIASMAKSRKDVKLIDLSRNFGNQIAITAGVQESGGDAVITMDGDLQHPPPVIPLLIAEWENGYEVVEGKRIGTRKQGFLKHILHSIFFYIMRHMSEIRLDKNISDFRLLDRKVVGYFKQISERKRFVRGVISWMGFRKSYVEYQVQQRNYGDTSFSGWKLFRLAVISLTSFSMVPLRVAAVLGTFITIVSSGLLIFMGYTYFFISEIIFRPIALFTVLNAIMGGLILICLGLISIYVGNMYEEVRNRPLYIIRERVNFDGDNKKGFSIEDKDHR